MARLSAGLLAIQAMPDQEPMLMAQVADGIAAVATVVDQHAPPELH